jgi:hypothetical protein
LGDGAGMNTDELNSTAASRVLGDKRINPIIVGCRLLGALALIAIALFCVFGFLASFEPANWLSYQTGYGILGCSCLIGAMAMLRRTGLQTLGALALFAVATFSVLGFMESSLSSRVAWQLVYGVFACGCLIGASALLFGRRGSKACGTDNPH